MSGPSEAAPPARWHRPRNRSGAAFALGLFALLALLVFIDMRLSLAYISYAPVKYDWPDQGWLDGFARLDSGWYHHIATKGYFYDGPHRQSAVAFFPAYPMAMRIVGLAVGNTITAGILVTLASGAGAAVLFFRWCTAALGRRTAMLALALMLVYPFSFYLFGAVYSDALFLVAVLAAFSLVESDHPVLAGLVGIVATADRPVGIALVIGLFLRALEVRGVLGGSRPRLFGPQPESAETPRIALIPRRLDLRRLRLADAGVLLAGLGFALFCVLLWWRFGEPFAFAKVADAPGWSRTINVRNLLKVNLYERWKGFGLGIVNFWLTVQGVFTLMGLAMVPAVIRRLGWGYGAYVFIALGMTSASSVEFVGMGRYVLAAFPLFAVAAQALSRVSLRWRWLPAATLTLSGLAMAWMVSLYARNYFLS